ncbi:type IV toxin-antitoxin system AbiEi family antitoxin [Rudanella paleaurantiibacter]|uniref:type IV toxin-antitoxin system AbiEi family antitoxin n=1 Tax=Rudanella paleaurantiibacter TaxID=2614655 RepID=UPI001FE78B16|nr:type IV toxin-antitoxin system AbiEi family antitoxin [Rudanella paleaurantiibacter]
MNKLGRFADQAVEGLRDATGLKVLWENKATPGLDGFVVIDTGNNTIRLPTQIRQRAIAHHVDELRQLSKPNTLLLAEHIPDSLKQTLRQTQQNYLDGAGNCYIHVGSVLIIVQGRKLAQAPVVAKQPFGKSGLRVLFTLLIHPDGINLSVRELAEQAGVSVGTAQHTIDYLKKSGYVVSVDAKRKKLTKLDKLRDQWVGRYAEALKPSLIVGRFRLPKNLFPADWRQVALQPGTYWSGEPAADALTNDLRPATLTLYTDQSKAGLLNTYKLLPDSDGPVEVNRLFWKPPVGQGDCFTVPPLLAYADLLAIDDPRTTDIARRIYQDHVVNV